jgi:3-deoxy-D-manno-octulosonate 8-phosphate phosphatase (KDO 8-P phosphatase)
MMNSLRKLARNIKALIVDVDGVLTDGGIILGSNNLEIKRFDVQDGMGITLARHAGLFVGAITGRESTAVARRLTELNFHSIIQNCPVKTVGYEKIKRQFNLTDEQIAYIGDDIQDLPVMRRVGLPLAVKNSVREVKRVARLSAPNSGGSGAVRYLVERILRMQGTYYRAVASVTSGKGFLTDGDLFQPAQDKLRCSDQIPPSWVSPGLSPSFDQNLIDIT